MKRFILIIIFLLVTNNLFAEAFADVMINPDAVARGNAFTGIANNPSAITYNPAGLAQLYQYILEFNYSNLFGINVIDYYSISLILPQVGPGTIGLSWMHQGIDDSLPIKNYKEEKFYLSYGFQLIDSLYLGSSFKYYYALYDTNKGAVYSNDLAVLWSLYKKIQFGIIFKDCLSPVIKWYSGEEEILKKRIRIGVGYYILNNIILSYDNEDLLQPIKKQRDYIGLEVLLFHKRLSLKTGLMNLYLNKLSFTGGFTYSLEVMNINYAFMNHHDLDWSHLWGLTLKF